MYRPFHFQRISIPRFIMVYIKADGSVEVERSIWRFSIVTDAIWAVVNEVGLFFQTLFNPTAPIPQQRITSSASSRANSGGAPSSSSGRGNNGAPPARKGSNIHILPKACTTNR